MDFTLTDIYGQEKGPLEHCGVNMVLGTDNDFQITIQNSLYDKERHGRNCRFFCPDTEYGGLIRNTNPITSDKTVKLTGMTWRGLLNQRAISPVKNTYVYLNGEANTALSTYIAKLRMTELFEVSGEDSGIILKNYQVPLQTMLLDAFDQALALQDARLEIRYKQGPANGRGHVLLRAVPITDHSSNIELNEDGSVKLNILDCQNGVNHLICLGAGELEQRQQVDLYAWPDGSIRKEQYYTGIERIEKLSTDTTVTLEPNKLYVFPEMESLTYTLGEGTGEVHFIFKSGATATRVVHPSGVNVGSFSVDANKVYEVSILEGLLTSQNWSVS